MKDISFDVSSAGRLDLLQIWNYLAENASLETADKVSADIESGIKRIAEFPGRGHRRSDLTQRNIYFYRVHSYLIVYRKDKKPIHVLRAVHSARDVKAVLEQ